MNYEELYVQLIEQVTQLKNSIAAAQRMQKTIAKDTESGDLKDLVKTLSSLQESISTQQTSVEALTNLVSQFDSAAYFLSGEFTEQLLDACRDRKIDVHGEFPVYEMFPNRVRIDVQNQEIYLDRKKIATYRPVAFADMVKAGHERLNKASFKADLFTTELASAYDTALILQKKQPEADVYLETLYKLMAPTSRARKEYDKLSFAFDIARLYPLQYEQTTKDGRRLQLGPSRKNNKAIRILDQDGKEQYPATIRFFR